MKNTLKTYLFVKLKYICKSFYHLQFFIQNITLYFWIKHICSKILLLCIIIWMFELCISSDIKINLHQKNMFFSFFKYCMKDKGYMDDLVFWWKRKEGVIITLAVGSRNITLGDYRFYTNIRDINVSILHLSISI